MTANGTAPTERANLMDSAAYPADPDKLCDIVMKGGVTSGVVYPQAICELATTFRFKNIGGTSAGAIAASATAAAEVARRPRGAGRVGGCGARGGGVGAAAAVAERWVPGDGRPPRRAGGEPVPVRSLPAST